MSFYMITFAKIMINVGSRGIICASCPCCAVTGVLSWDNSVSIIHIAPTPFGEYRHTATICLDPISRRGRAGGREKWWEGTRGRKDNTNRKVMKHKYGSHVLPGSPETLFKQRLLWRTSCVYGNAISCCRAGLSAAASAREIFICGLCLLWNVKQLLHHVKIRCFCHRISSHQLLCQEANN